MTLLCLQVLAHKIMTHLIPEVEIKPKNHSNSFKNVILTSFDHKREHCCHRSQWIKQWYWKLSFLFISSKRIRAVKFPSDNGTVIWLHTDSFHAGFLTVWQILYLAWKSEPVENLLMAWLYSFSGEYHSFQAAAAGDLIEVFLYQRCFCRVTEL